MLEEKCKSCTPSEAKFIKAYFKGAKSASNIEESINEARSAYKKLQSERRQSLIEESNKKVSKSPDAVVTESKKEDKKKESPKKIVTEAKQEQPAQVDVVDIYSAMLKF